MFWGWGRLAASPPTGPIPYKENVIFCHSERSEESTVFYRTILKKNIIFADISNEINMNVLFFKKRTDHFLQRRNCPAPLTFHFSPFLFN